MVIVFVDRIGDRGGSEVVVILVVAVVVVIMVVVVVVVIMVIVVAEKVLFGDICLQWRSSRDGVRLNRSARE